MIVAQFALANVHRGCIQAALRRAVADEVFGFGNDGVVARERIPLGSLNIGESELSGEIRVFAEVLFHASPARFARQVEHRRKNHVHSGSPHFVGYGRAGFAG